MGVIDMREGLAAFLADPERYYNETPLCERQQIAAQAAQRIAELEAENERLRDRLARSETARDELRVFVAVLDGARAALLHSPVVRAENDPA